MRFPQLNQHRKLLVNRTWITWSKVQGETYLTMPYFGTRSVERAEENVLTNSRVQNTASHPEKSAEENVARRDV